jgi:outer membrane lipoprotein LolB
MRRRAACRVAAAGWIGLSLLAGCASTPPAAMDTSTSHISGRLGIVVEGQASRSFSAGFELLSRPDGGQISLNNTLGLKVGEVRWQGSLAELRTSDGVRQYDSLEALATDVMGEPLPLGALPDWLQGHPWSGAPYRTLEAPAAGFEQLGWRVDTARLSTGLLTATRSDPPPKVTVRARLDNP